MAASESGLFRVKGGTDARALASAIANQIYEGKTPTLRAIGAAAVNQAAKAIAIAGGYFGPKGMILLTRHGFADVTMPEGVVTAMIFQVIATTSILEFKNDQ